MRIDFDILKEAGTTNDRLRQIFTAKRPSRAKWDKLTRTEQRSIEKDMAIREKLERKIAGWMNEHILFSLQNHQFYSAVDLAWDSSPINKTVYPLMLYAQGRIDVKQCNKSLQNLPEGKTYLRKNDKGEVLGINLPKFFDVNVNLVRSIITRRHAAQTKKFNNLWPFFKYESRIQSQVGKLRAEAQSQRADIIADQYDYRHIQSQIIRDMLLYGHTVAFPRAAWEREVQWVKKASAALVKGPIPKRGRIVKEGIYWTIPHPSRLFWDNEWPLASINSDTGCEYIGFWDVTRWHDVSRNPNYFNRKSVWYNTDLASWFAHYSLYFNQYFDQITPPNIPQDVPGLNDRKNNVGFYTAELDQAAVFLSHLYIKVTPREWRMGSYPHPIWIHLTVAGNATVVAAEIMPSSPGAVFSYNENDGRLVNISLAHELMPYQDQLTNLTTQLLEVTKRDLFTVAMLNRDIFGDDEDGRKARKDFKTAMHGNNWYSAIGILETSFAKLHQMGIATTADNIFKIVRASPNSQITEIFNSITQLVATVERLMALSPQEQGQPAPREITATETTLIATTTESVYNFISDSIDEGRAAMKRILYESDQSLGDEKVRLTVTNHYPEHIVQAAGFVYDDEDEGEDASIRVIRGTKRTLLHDYVFTSRDGGDRASSVQAATALVEMLRSIGQLPPEAARAILSAMGKTKIFEIYNEIFRLAGAGVNLKLEVHPDEGDELLIDDSQQVMQFIERLAQAVQQNSADLDSIKQLIGAIPTPGSQPRLPGPIPTNGQ